MVDQNKNKEYTDGHNDDKNHESTYDSETGETKHYHDSGKCDYGVVAHTIGSRFSEKEVQSAVDGALSK